MALVTISRQFGSRGDELARELAARTGFRLITREAVEATMRNEFGAEPPVSLHAPTPIPAQLIENACTGAPMAGEQTGGNGRVAAAHSNGEKIVTPAPTAGAQAAEICLYADMVAGILADLASRQHLIVLGCGGQLLFADAACAVHVRVVAPRAWRAASVAADLGLPPPAASALAAREDAQQSRYMRAVFGRSAMPPEHYHLVLNTAALDFDQAVDAVLAVLESSRIRQAGMLSVDGVERVKVRSKMRLARSFADLPGSPLLERVAFAHPSERVFARLMDFYGVEWEYEPRTFPIEWNERQDVTEAFTPDFYLPELDLYVELTTMKQSLVTKKNRKVKRLRQFYPDVNIRVFYQKDVEDLIFKLGVREPVRR